MAFAKLSGSLLESDARPARTPEQSVSTPAGAEHHTAPAADERSILERFACLAEAAPLYDSLWEFIRTGDEEGVARVVSELVRAGRSIAEISEMVEGLSQLVERAAPGASRHAGDESPPGPVPEIRQTLPESLLPDSDETRDREIIDGDSGGWVALVTSEADYAINAWPVAAAELEAEPVTDAPPQPLHYPAPSSEELSEVSSAPVIPADERQDAVVDAVPQLPGKLPSALPWWRSLSPPAYIGAAMAAVVAIAGAGAFLLAPPAETKVVAAPALPGDMGASLALAQSVTGAAAAARPKTALPPAGTAAHEPEAAPAPLPNPPALSPAPKTSEAAPAATEKPRASVPPAPAATAPIGSPPATAPVLPASSAGDRAEAKPADADAEAAVKLASLAPTAADRGVPAATAAAALPTRTSAEPAEAKPAVASLEVPKTAPPPTPGSSLPARMEPPMVSSGEPAPSTEPVASPVDTAPLLDRGDHLFGTGDVASARLFYERAAEDGNAQAALRLGETYDPAFLQRAQLRVASDRGLALFWYGRARELGAGEADILLKGMQSR